MISSENLDINILLFWYIFSVKYYFFINRVEYKKFIVNKNEYKVY
jgi:hypothetical protein